MQKTNRAIIFVHYDKHDMVDAYVYTYLKELQQNASHLVFVSPIVPEQIKDVTKLNNLSSIKELFILDCKQQLTERDDDFISSIINRLHFILLSKKDNIILNGGN